MNEFVSLLIENVADVLLMWSFRVERDDDLKSKAVTFVEKRPSGLEMEKIS
jgi:hypothetical protein